MPDLVPVRRALISVSDKTGVVDFARALASRGVEIISTGGTAKALTDAGIKVIPIEEVTKFPEMMDGRLKTLHPLIHGGILAVRDDAAHLKSMKEHGITPIDLVCVNLYPFEQTVAKPGVTLEEAIENIDIGGPTMIRAAAKNWEWVAAVTAPSQYRMVLDDLTGHNGCTSRVTRYALAHGVFELINGYDRAIAVHLISALTGNRDLQPAMYPITARMKELGDARLAAFAVRNPEFRDDGILPRFVSLQSKRHTELRYGENPHQQAAVYRDGLSNGPSLIAAEQLHGKELSYNNLNDAAAAMGIVEDFARLVPDHVGACVIKHTNPCGAAVAGSVAQAIDLAMIGDPLAAYGGILAVNQPIDLAGAKRLCREGVFLEVILAPSFAPDAVAALAQHSKMVRLLAIGESWPGKPGPAASASPSAALQHLTLKPIPGGLLVQTRDDLIPDTSTWQHKAGPAPSGEQLADAAVVWMIVKHLTSNAIAIGGREPDDEGNPKGYGVRLFGAGAGQMDRVTSCRLAIEKAGPLAKGAIAASDAFFPFPDGPELLIDAGVKMIVHTGGSKRDEETFKLCERRGVTCMVTGVRHFRH